MFGGQLGTWDQPYGSQLPSPVAGPASPVDIVVPFFTPQREPTPDQGPSSITIREPTPVASSETPSRSVTPESTQELEAKGKAPERAPGLTIAEIMAGTQTITAGMVQLQPQQQQQAPAQQGGGGGPPAGGGGPAGGQPAGGPPAGGPPAGGGGPPGGGCPPGGGQPPAVPAAAAAAPQNGSLGGKAPTTYDRDRSKTRIFIHQFKLYRMANATNFKMINPTTRVSLFLSFMDGPKVIGWAQQQVELLEHRILGYIPCLNGRNSCKRKWNEAASSKHLLELGMVEKEISAQGKTSSEESWTLTLSQGETLAIPGQGTPYVVVKRRYTRADRTRGFPRSSRPNRARPGLCILHTPHKRPFHK
jgi:hypothetical protein